VMEQTVTKSAISCEPSVLIVADDADFTRTITSRWQTELHVPTFTLMTGDLCPGIHPQVFDLAIVGGVRAGVLPSVLTILEAVGKPVIFLAPSSQAAATVQDSHKQTLVLRQHEGWQDALILLASEGLRACEALARAERAEQCAASREAQAMLGRYILEMRHTLNNALTSILGNSELLLAEPGTLSAISREQLETVRNMAVRMNEIFQRFSSLETELRYVERQAAQQARAKTRSASVGV
jgi:signal transduction histidine kinase